MSISSLFNMHINRVSIDNQPDHVSRSHCYGYSGVRERQCILKAFDDVLPGSLILYLPCGAGKVYRYLKDRGYNVVSADISPYQVNCTLQTARSLGYGNRLHDTFEVANLFETGFKDHQFDAVICNRLFHLFRKPETRRNALRELRRICSGPIVISFFSSFSVEALNFYYQKRSQHTAIPDWNPINPFYLAEDIRQSGLKVEKWIPVRLPIWMQWYVKLRKG